MSSGPIQWFPGHMAKTRRLIKESLPRVDIVLELLDARIPASSANPEVASLLAGKPSLVLLNKSSLADPSASAEWLAKYRASGREALLTDCSDMTGISAVGPTVRSILAEKLERWRGRGMEGRRPRAMIVGIPNVGKSTLMNRLCGGYKAKVEDRPGVTLRAQWSSSPAGLELLDMPGVLWPKFDPKTGLNLAITGAVKDVLLDLEEVAASLCAFLAEFYPRELAARYKLEPASIAGVSGADILAAAAARRGFLLPGGVADTGRAAAVLLDEFRAGKIGRITLDR